jgi:molybdopterin molybdotransferase
MLEVEAALDIVLEHTTALSTETISDYSALLGRIMAESISSDIDSPPFTKSMMDGFALRAGDERHGPLPIVEVIAAGQMPRVVVESGQASRIMTGAPLPPGADSVVMHERCTVDEERTVTVNEAIKLGQNVVQRGQEMQQGEVVLTTGTSLGPQEIGLLAAVGRTSLSVYRQPQVAIISTGDELLEPNRFPGPGQIRNSNGPMLVAQTLRARALPHYRGIVPDQREYLQTIVADSLEKYDVILLSGGVSAGAYDFVPEVLTSLGIETHFHKIKLKPGKPLLFGTKGRQLIFGLPGNPLSSFVGFELFVRPALRRMRGLANANPYFTSLPLQSELVCRGDRRTFIPAKIEWEMSGVSVRPFRWFGSADLRAMGRADALLSVEPGSHTFAAGTPVTTVLLTQD